MPIAGRRWGKANLRENSKNLMPLAGLFRLAWQWYPYSTRAGPAIYAWKRHPYPQFWDAHVVYKWGWVPPPGGMCIGKRHQIMSKFTQYIPILHSGSASEQKGSPPPTTKCTCVTFSHAYITDMCLEKKNAIMFLGPRSVFLELDSAYRP